MMARPSVVFLAVLVSVSIGVSSAQFEDDGERPLKILLWACGLAGGAGSSRLPCKTIALQLNGLQALHGAAFSIRGNAACTFKAETG